MSTPKPLWRVMQLKRHHSLPPDGDFWREHHGFAAELRAIANEIDERFKRLDYMTAEEITTWLRAEADRSEVGE